MTLRAPGPVAVIGGGPAGAAAALAALSEGSAVTIYERSPIPRHKVCGEFLSPEITSTLEALDLGPAFTAARPARIARAVLHLGGREKRFRLPEPAHGLSRLALDHMLLREAVRRGAELRTQWRKLDQERSGSAADGVAADTAIVVAHGRQTATRSRERLFGFKAHYRGPSLEQVDDAVELFFFGDSYVGVSPVERGAMNVCGLAPEASLRACGFRPEVSFPAGLSARLRRLERSFDWILTGPLVFRNDFQSRAGRYLAGDALGFVDPFTGSGILAAMVTGRLAGRAASRRLAFERYYAECRRKLRRQYRMATVLRGMLGAGLSGTLARWIPGSLLYRLTRPSV